MEIRIKDAGEFYTLLNALIGELTQAQDHFGLVTDLNAAARAEYAQVFDQSRTFWYLTYRAQREATLHRLYRAYDKDSRSLSLLSLLDTIATNVHYFDEAEFRERLKDNPFVDSLAETARRPDLTQLKLDQDLVNEATNPLVKNLRMWRNKAGAHRDANTLLEGVSLDDEYPLSFTDIQTLLNHGVRIVNHYSNLFTAAVHADRMLGHDDYLGVLRAVQAQLDAYDARRQEEGPGSSA